MDLNENSAAARLMVTAESDNTEGLSLRSNVQPFPDSQNITKSSFSQAQADDYYEVISADGSIGADDISDDDIIVSEDADSGHLEQPDDYSLNDLPFVPKFAFSNEFDSGVNDDVQNNEILHVNKIIPHRPTSNYSRRIDVSVPPPFFDPSIPPPNFNHPNHTENEVLSEAVHSYPDSVINVPNLNPLSSDRLGEIPQNQVEPQVPTSNCHVVEKEVPLGNPGLSAKDSSSADWLDENGDPIKGAFDNINPEEPEDEGSDSDLKGTKIEYVYSVKEKKLLPVKCEESGDGALINSTVSIKNIAGNLGLLESQLATQAFYNTKVIDAEEEKKLYEASKSGAEYKAALQAAAATVSSGADPASAGSIPENGSVKKERFNRFKRNRFTDKKEETEVNETSTEETKKSQEDVALESQAVTEILREVQRGAARAKEQGALGWQKCPVPVTNKTFLRNTLVSTLREPYRPPNKQGRFHVGLHNKGKDSNNDKEHDYHDSSSKSSRSSRSYSSSRSRNSRSSRSHSGSSYRSDDSRHSRSSRRRGRHRRGGGRGGWGGGPDQYYDEAWAAYAAQYGYPWYGPEAYAMYYGNEGWPMDAYAAMYYGDPQAWAEYGAYYGPQQFHSRGRGRGMRGRGMGRGRGRGGYQDDFRDYERDSYSSSPDSISQGARTGSWSPEYSRSRSISKSKGDRSRGSSHGRSRSRDCNASRSRSGEYSRGSSRDQKSNEKNVSDSQSKKRKKKKKKHKSKKAKHRRKDDEDCNEENLEDHEGEGKKKKNSNNKDISDKTQENMDKDDQSSEKKNKEEYGKKDREKKRKKHKNKDKGIKENKYRSKGRKKDEPGNSEEKPVKDGPAEGDTDKKQEHKDDQKEEEMLEKGTEVGNEKSSVQEKRLDHDDAANDGDEKDRKLGISSNGVNDGMKNFSDAEDDKGKQDGESEKVGKEEKNKHRKIEDETRGKELSSQVDGDCERQKAQKHVDRENTSEDKRNPGKKHREKREGSTDKEKRCGGSGNESRHKEERDRGGHRQHKEERVDSSKSKESKHREKRDDSEESVYLSKRKGSEDRRHERKRDYKGESRHHKKRDDSEDRGYHRRGISEESSHGKKRDDSEKGRHGKNRDGSEENKLRKRRDDSEENTREKDDDIENRHKGEKNEYGESSDNRKSEEGRSKRDDSTEGWHQEIRGASQKSGHKKKRDSDRDNGNKERRDREKRHDYEEMKLKDKREDGSSSTKKKSRTDGNVERGLEKERYDSDRGNSRGRDGKISKNDTRKYVYPEQERDSREKISHSKHSATLAQNKDRGHGHSNPVNIDYQDLRYKLKRSNMQTQNRKLDVRSDEISDDSRQQSSSEVHQRGIKRNRESDENSLSKGNEKVKNSQGKEDKVKNRKSGSSTAENNEDKYTVFEGDKTQTRNQNSEMDRKKQTSSKGKTDRGSEVSERKNVRIDREKQKNGTSIDEMKAIRDGENIKNDLKAKKNYKQMNLDSGNNEMGNGVGYRMTDKTISQRAKAEDADRGTVHSKLSMQDGQGTGGIDGSASSTIGQGKKLVKKVIKRRKKIDDGEPKPVVKKKKKVVAKKNDAEGGKCEEGGAEAVGLKKKKTKVKVKKKVKKVIHENQGEGKTVICGSEEKQDEVSSIFLESKETGSILQHGSQEMQREGDNMLCKSLEKEKAEDSAIQESQVKHKKGQNMQHESNSQVTEQEWEKVVLTESQRNFEGQD